MTKLFFILFSFAPFLLFSQVFNDSINLAIAPNWWIGVVDDGYKMPITKGYRVDFRTENFNNQVQPLMLSNLGDVVWSEHAFTVTTNDQQIKLKSQGFQFTQSKNGHTLRDAYQFASKTYFPPSGKLPDEMFFTHPQYNTWIELTYNQNQADVLTYARGILSNGLPPGILMIDDTWQEAYGKWKFHPGRFPNPKAMLDTLHTMGFKVMLWLCPFVSADSEEYRLLSKQKALLFDVKGRPAMVRWWNGVSALLDFSNPDAINWFSKQMDYLMNMGVDGFKFDAGDYHHYVGVQSFKEHTPQQHSQLYGKIGLNYPLNEYRAMWQMGGQALVQRLGDKSHGFEALQLLIPNMLNASLMGYYFSCPDMIGGGQFTSFLEGAIIDEESIVRSAQCHALMPMMQFSVAPWRILNKQNMEAVKKAVAIREKFRFYILDLAKKTAITGEPMMKYLEYSYPHQGYATIKDQFMLGDNLLVAPVLTKSATKRNVILPKGKWRDSSGKEIKGGQTISIDVDLYDLPYFERIR